MNEYNLLGQARFVKGACQQNQPLKKSTWEVCCSSPVFSVNSHESVLKAHILDVTYCYDLNSVYFEKECAGYNVSDLLKRSNNLVF